MARFEVPLWVTVEAEDKQKAFGLVFNCFQMYDDEKKDVLFDIGDPIEILPSKHEDVMELPL